MKNLKELGKKKLITLGAVAVIGVAGVSGLGYKVYADNLYKENVTHALKQEQTKKDKLSKVEQEILALYQDELKDFLANDVTVNTVNGLREAVEPVTKPSYDVKSGKLTIEIDAVLAKKETVVSDLVTVEEKIVIQDKVNGLFQKEKAINGKTVKDNLVIVDNLKAETIPNTKDFDKDSKWTLAMNKVIGNAMTQLKQIDSATKVVNGLYDKKEVSKKATVKDVEKATKEVKGIKNEKARKALEARVKKVSDELKKREKAAAEKKAKEVGGKVVETSDGKVVIEDQSGNTLTQEGQSNNWKSDTQTQQWTADNQSSGSNNQLSNQGNGSSTQNGSNNSGSTSNNTWTPPATNNGGGNSSSGSNNSNSGSTGGGSTNNGNSDSGNQGGGTTTPPPTAPAEVTLVSGTVGNGGIFGSYEAAVDWGIAKQNDNAMNGTGSGSYSVSILYYSDGSEKY
ncbi:hypothetical protein [Vagococcus salmoninarum]|uniref:hypothetical protein n=1 Tax=Vagococcus salmoninarum TaxID=2739 RepID=UPI0028D1E02A|nr:hypothetical protein [Vagococcus salmoninarum]